MTRSRIHVLYLQPAPLFGGAERQAAEQASYLPDFGVDVTVMAGPGRAIIDWLYDGRVRHVVPSENFPGGGRPRKGLRRLTLPYHFLELGVRARAQMEELIEHSGIDVIFASLPFAWITGSLAAKRAGIPIAWRAGGHYINPAQVAGMWSLTHFLRPDLLVCNSKAVEHTFHPLIPAPAAILPNGVDTRVFNPKAGVAARYRPAGAGFVIGFAGRLATSKRPQDVIELAARLRATHPETRVLIAGEGTKRPDYERRARDSGADNVTFLGYVADMPSFYAACDLIVLPSRSEGSSNTLLEAMACGKPVIASDIPPLREQLEPGVTGIIYPLGDVDALTRSARELIADSDLRHALAERGYAVASRATAWASAERLAELLKRLVAEADAKRARARTAGPRRLEIVRESPAAAFAGTLHPSIRVAGQRDSRS